MWTQISLAVVEMIISVPEVHALYKLKPKSHKQTGELNATKVWLFNWGLSAESNPQIVHRPKKAEQISI